MSVPFHCVAMPIQTNVLKIKLQIKQFMRSMKALSDYCIPFDNGIDELDDNPEWTKRWWRHGGLVSIILLCVFVFFFFYSIVNEIHIGKICRHLQIFTFSKISEKKNEYIFFSFFDYHFNDARNRMRILFRQINMLILCFE